MNHIPKNFARSGPRFYSDRGLLFLFLPLIVEQTLKYGTGLVDSLMVSSLGEAAISGVSLIDFVMSFLTSLIAALLVGGSAIISQSIGAKDMPSAQAGVNLFIKSVIVFSVGLSLLTYILQDFILTRLFGHLDADVYNHADAYLSILTGSIPLLGLYSVGANIFRCMNNTLTPMLIMLTSNILNIIGNAVCIYYLGLGTQGIAASTFVSRLIAAIWILLMLTDKKRLLHITGFFSSRFEFSILKKILGIGVPTGVENGTFFLGRILVLGIVASLGTSAIASNAVAGVLSNFQVIPGLAIAFGTTVVIGRCAGSGDLVQTKYYTRKIIAIVYCVQLITISAVYLVLPRILDIYSLSPETSNAVSEIMMWHSVVAITIWPLAYILPATFRASGDARFPMSVGIISLFARRLFCAWLFGIYLEIGIIGIWIGMFADWILKAVAFVVRYFSGNWFSHSAP